MVMGYGMRSTVNAAVLSLLIEHPSYGGEIGRRFDDRFDGLLFSGPQHIYKSLDDLEKQGLIERVWLEEEEREGFRATAQGARAYGSWLRAPIPASGRARNELMVRIAATRPRDVESLELLADRYEAMVLAMARKGRAPAGTVVDRLVDEERRTLHDAQLRWIARVRDELRDLAANGDG
jgi:DNA-binding PadR family transcriptional regulator